MNKIPKLSLKQIPKHGDDRGFLIEFLREDDNFLNFKGQVYASTIAPETIRGNHYHNDKTEVFTVMKGILKVLVQHIESKEIKEYILDSSGEELDRIVVEPKYAHTFINIGKEEVVLLAWGDHIHDHSGPDQHEFIIKNLIKD
ncbi:MAG: WxcM-like domain-containing protein [Candidatus Delongbacteria bacterium]|jgi:dTDP-4-dehydrorhamnose 3,5-epimerase-like enzyme|nr:WxcM-like domain-containing protein [Candidatus Delongbacteria bacterium]